jgi:phosphorylcholine metabolism protein LicD
VVMKFAHSQKGLSMLSWLVVLAVVAFFASMTFKMLPHYMDYMSLEKMIASVETEPSQEIRSVSDFYSKLSSGMMVNNIRDLNLKESIKITVENGEFLVHVKYEKREPLIENLDLVARFDKEFRVRMP